MPTITIRTGQIPVVERRAIAVKLTRWLVETGVPASHVVVCFEEIPNGTVFSGGMPVESIGADNSRISSAAIFCRIAPDRDEHFRHSLAQKIVELLPAGHEMPLIYIEFQATPPSDVWIGSQGRLGPVGSPSAEGEPSSQSEYSGGKI
jgi:phenylpyruvate tautomerase PptA (4-oxalocrotonate tautomerase family)